MRTKLLLLICIFAALICLSACGQRRTFEKIGETTGNTEPATAAVAALPVTTEPETETTAPTTEPAASARRTPSQTRRPPSNQSDGQNANTPESGDTDDRGNQPNGEDTQNPPQDAENPEGGNTDSPENPSENEPSPAPSEPEPSDTPNTPTEE